jgi:hypothetical protein
MATTTTTPPAGTQVTNPYANKTTAQVQDEAENAVTQATTTGYTASTIGAPTGYTAADATATGFAGGVTAGTDAAKYEADKAKAEGYTATSAQNTAWNLDPSKQTVAGQVEGLIAKNSPLMQQAETSALQQMNRRGLLNSSMAVGAGQEAVLKQALPIAQADATAYQAQAKFNAEQSNQLSQFNATLTSEASKFGANATNVIATANQAATNEALKAGATAENIRSAAYTAAYNDALKFGASATNAASLANAAADSESAKFTATATNAAAAANAEATNRAKEFEATGKNTAAREYAAALNETTQSMLDNSLKISMANADSATKLELQNIDATTRKDLANIEAKYKNEMQASSSANEIFQQTTKNIADIMANPDLASYATSDGKAPTEDKKNWPPGATKLTNGKLYDANNKEIVSPKQAAVDTQKSYLQGSMMILSTTSGIQGLKDLITF